MKAITVDSIVRKHSKIPTEWKRKATPNRLTSNYRSLGDAEHFIDGWRDVVKPEYNDETHKLGYVVYNPEDDNYTYEVIEMDEDESRRYLDDKESKDEASRFITIHKREGIVAFDKIMALIQRRVIKERITKNQAKNFVVGLYPAIECLYKGQWRLARINVHNLELPEEEELLKIIDRIKDRIYDYVNDNDL
jgi:hypothetical protein